MNRRLSLLFILIISLLLAFSGCTAGNGEASSSDLQEEPERNLTDLIQGDPALQIVYAFGLSASPHNTAGGRELYHWLQTEQAVNYLEAYRIGDFPQQIWERYHAAHGSSQSAAFLSSFIPLSLFCSSPIPSQ